MPDKIRNMQGGKLLRTRAICEKNYPKLSPETGPSGLKGCLGPLGGEKFNEINKVSDYDWLQADYRFCNLHKSLKNKDNYMYVCLWLQNKSY